MNIAEASRISGLPAKTIRYYEEINLLRPARGDNGYRSFTEADTQRLTFLGRARSLGFSISECRALLTLQEDGTRASSDVKAVASEHLNRISQKIKELETLKSTLEELVTACNGDDSAECAILDDLAGGPRRAG